jgi:hypothetical protein
MIFSPCLGLGGWGFIRNSYLGWDEW